MITMDNLVGGRGVATPSETSLKLKTACNLM